MRYGTNDMPGKNKSKTCPIASSNYPTALSNSTGNATVHGCPLSRIYAPRKPTLFTSGARTSESISATPSPATIRTLHRAVSSRRWIRSRRLASTLYTEGRAIFFTGLIRISISMFLIKSRLNWMNMGERRCRIRLVSWSLIVLVRLPCLFRRLEYWNQTIFLTISSAERSRNSRRQRLRRI